MPSSFSVSIIICTCNRALALQETLKSFHASVFPKYWRVELIVVDNGSTDETPSVVKNIRIPLIEFRYYRDVRKGKGNALNTGLAAARGEIILFTDDDVRPAPDWIVKLASPLFAGEADAAGGTIRLAPQLARPWLTENYKRWLAWCEPPLSEPLELIGANMGIRRDVLQKVPGFDPELGPGAAGLGEDTLFGWQLSEAGFVLHFAPDAIVTHHPDGSRLLRRSWLAMGQMHGRKEAYLAHHWKHEPIRAAGLKSIWIRLKLVVRRMLQPPVPSDDEGCARWEMSYVGSIEMLRKTRIETKRMPNYIRRGLRRRNHSTVMMPLTE